MNVLLGIDSSTQVSMAMNTEFVFIFGRRPNVCTLHLAVVKLNNEELSKWCLKFRMASEVTVC